MENTFAPQLDIMPDAQRRLWPELADTPTHFTLYGGTAIALRLGHRPSVDFDFFSPELFEPQSLLDSVPFLKGADIRKSGANELTATVDRGSPIQLQFFGNFDLGQVAPSEIAKRSEWLHFWT
jgi:Nucleotidyl transferase AbiEii toxin, Type IV TA system